MSPMSSSMMMMMMMIIGMAVMITGGANTGARLIIYQWNSKSMAGAGGSRPGAGRPMRQPR
jgi:hypothetical protein